MRMGISTDKAAEAIADGMKKVAKAACDAAENFSKNNNFHVDSTYRIVKDDEIDTMNLYQLIEMLAEGKSLPKKIKYQGVTYTNVTRTGLNILYYSDCTEQNFKKEILTRGHGETDVDILNREFEVLEW